MPESPVDNVAAAVAAVVAEAPPLSAAQVRAIGAALVEHSQ